MIAFFLTFAWMARIENAGQYTARPAVGAPLGTCALSNALTVDCINGGMSSALTSLVMTVNAMLTWTTNANT